MARPKKNPTSPVTVRIDQTLYDRLNEFCMSSGQSKTAAVERALDIYIEDYYDKQKIIEDANRKY